MSLLRPSATFTTEFGHEFEAERERLLRRRFLWYTAVNWVLGILAVIIGAVTIWFSQERGIAAQVVAVLANAVLTVVYLGAFLHVRRSSRTQIPVKQLAYGLIVLTGVVSLLVGVVTAETTRGMKVRSSGFRGVGVSVTDPKTPDSSPDPGQADSDALPTTPPGDGGVSARNSNEEAEDRNASNERVGSMTVAASGIAQILVSHFFACLFLPWTPRESVRPLVPLLALNAVITLVYMILGGAWVFGTLTILLSPLIGVPGAGVCWWRHSRMREGFQTKLVYRRYGEMRQELFNARQIHEALFPKACTEGPARFSYRYEPMRQIGGDYLYASHWRREDAEPVLSLVILDVTGHGIPAALTVNRLHGELERIFAEEPGTPPGEVLRLLNRYVHLTLATHSVYVTAVCLRVDPNAGTLEYASGGHPPAFIRTVDDHIEELNSTAFVLGVCAAADFNSAPASLPFGPGDTLIVYTDGAIEARDKSGRMYGITGLRRLIAQGRPDAVGGWPAAILGEVDAFRHGPPADDTLVIEIVRPLDSALAADDPAQRAAATAEVSSSRP